MDVADVFVFGDRKPYSNRIDSTSDIHDY